MGCRTSARGTPSWAATVPLRSRSKTASASGATSKVTAASLARNTGGTLNFVGNNAALGGGNNQIFFSAIPTIAGNTSVSGGVSREGILPYATVNNADFASTLNTDSRT